MTNKPINDAADKPVDNDPALQGEGNYTAARRHRKSVEEFVASGQVEPAAQAAAPQSDADAKGMKEAEKQGEKHARH